MNFKFEWYSGGIMKFRLAKELTQKQKMLCELYLRYNGDLHSIYKMAGYASVSSAKTALKGVKASAYLKELEEVRAEILQKELRYSAVESFNNLQKAQDLALTKQKLIVSKTGLYKQDDKDLTNFIKAEELKGKLAGLYKQEEEEKKPMTIMNIIRYDDRKDGGKSNKKKFKIKRA